MDRRAIPPDVVESVLDHPEQVVPASAGRQVYQSRIKSAGGKTYLVRVVVAVPRGVVVTVYRTSKIEKCWRRS